MTAEEQALQLILSPPDRDVMFGPEIWEGMQTASVRQGIAPLLAYAIRNKVSQEQKIWCDHVLKRSWARHERNMVTLRRAASALAGAGIPFISLKGPVMGMRYYDPPFLRKPSLDLDLAITLRDLPRACEVLAARRIFAAGVGRKGPSGQSSPQIWSTRTPFH